MTHLYDAIGQTYKPFRQPDKRIEAAILSALGGCASVLNVGAGAGSYEPTDRQVTAVELSMTMIKQRSTSSAPVVQANSIALPFADQSFAAASAILTIHHWSDQIKGIQELRRVARERVVVYTWDPEAPVFWLNDYFPEIFTIDRPIFPSMDLLEQYLGAVTVRPVMIPHDCTDGFLGAYWQKPEAYLDAGIRSAISTFSKIQNLDSGVEKLANDLKTGAWEQRHGELRRRTQLDLGYRLVVADIG